MTSKGADLKKAFEEYIENAEPVENLTLNDKVLIIDGLNTFIRAFSVNPALNEDGVHIGGIIGFLKSVRFAINKLQPTRVVIVFDGKGGSKKRRAIYPEYKAQRRVKTRLNRNVDWSTNPIDEEQSMKQQISRLVNYLEMLPVKIISIDGIEADDVMAYLTMTVFRDSKVQLMSTDKDFLQLVSDRVELWSPTKSVLYNRQKVKDEYGIIPENLITWRTLDGDKSDNIPGIRGAGLKTVIKYFPEIAEDEVFTVKDLLSKYGQIESKFKIHQTVQQNIDMIKRNYVLMQLQQVDIHNRKKLLIQNSFDSNDETLVKFQFQKMFIQDKLWGALPNLDTWMMEFIRLNNYLRNKNDK
tara:strand:- start:1565 stop:2629 length:1065 start_codon:yes stop_codon:yes gene_type:complete